MLKSAELEQAAYIYGYVKHAQQKGFDIKSLLSKIGPWLSNPLVGAILGALLGGATGFGGEANGGGGRTGKVLGRALMGSLAGGAGSYGLGHARAKMTGSEAPPSPAALLDKAKGGLSNVAGGGSDMLANLQTALQPKAPPTVPGAGAPTTMTNIGG